MSLLKKLAGETALYGLSSILGRLLNYVLVPIHASIAFGFSRSEYGVLTLFFAFAAFLNILFTYGLETAYFRFASREDAQKIYNIIFSQVLISTAVLGGLGLAFAPLIVDWLGFPERTAIFQVLILIVSIDTLLAIPYARLRHEHKAKFFVFTKLANIGLTVFLNVFFLIVCRQIFEGHWLPSLQAGIATFYDPSIGIGYVFLANLIANGFVFLLLYRTLFDFKFTFDSAKMHTVLVYAYPIMLMGLAGMVNQMFDKILLQYLLPEGFYEGKTNTEIVGMYGACAKLAIFTNLAIQAFRYAAEPFFFGQAQDRQAPALFAKVMHYFVVVSVLIWLGVSLNLDILKWVFLPNPVFHEALIVVPVLLLGNVFLGIYFNLSIWFKLTDQTHFGTWISAGGALLTLVLSFVLVPLLGYIGSAWVVLLTYFLMSVACYAIGQRYYPIPYRLGAALLHFGLGAILIFSSFQITYDNFWLRFLINLGLFSTYLTYIFFTERKQLTA